METIMNKQPRSRCRAAVTVLLGTFAAVSLSACAAGITLQGDTATHLCKPKEVVGFSCELADHRLLSLCGSPGFNEFQGKPEDNPGYAYVAVGSKQGKVQFTHPRDPKEYKRYMTQTVSVTAQHNMFVETESGAFLSFSIGRDVEPMDQLTIDADRSPTGWWSKGTTALEPKCLRRNDGAHLGSFMSRMVDNPEWVKNRKSKQ
jgi:hypothetical protein